MNIKISLYIIENNHDYKTVYESGDIMDFRQLETFIEVVNLKSFSKAAKKLFLTQPTVTNHIQSLEKELGTPLINRSCKDISVTKAGNILYSHALSIINIRDSAEFELNMYKGNVEGHLEISSSSIPKQYVLPYILKAFVDKYPKVTFSITHNDSKQVVENIKDGYIDFGIVGAKYNSNNLQYLNLIKDKLVIVTPNNKNYPWNPFEKLDLNFLLGEKVILREEGSGSRYLVEKILTENNFDIKCLDVIACIEDNETIKKFVQLGMGISFISQMAIKKEIKEKTLKAFSLKDIKLTRDFYFVYHKKRHLSPLAQTFRNFVINYIDEMNKIPLSI